MSVFFSSQKTVFEKLARHLLNTSSIASYLSSFLKLFLITISIAPQHLLDSWLSVEFPETFSYRNLDSTSTPGGSIEKFSDLSTTPRHLVDRSSIILAFGVFLSRQLLDTLSVDIAFSRHLLDR